MAPIDDGHGRDRRGSEGRRGRVSGQNQDAEALIERRGAAGVIVLNRPKALNALTLTMVRLMARRPRRMAGRPARSPGS